ncbi:cytochrome P450 2D10-like [Peromyscus maniculatus bairdii]|uniref:cytochrome P450 2D10-like n=1 Tax=Peromyscus maniculatus bairdii TaxID=230844 RepID=UPI003FD60983
MELLTGCGLGSVAIFTVLFILLVDLMHRRQRWTSCYPPGPVPLPVLGNLLQVDFNDMPYSLYKLRQCYGDVFSLQMARRPVVVINGLKAVREVLVNCGEDTSDRPPMPVLKTWLRPPSATLEGAAESACLDSTGTSEPLIFRGLDPQQGQDCKFTDPSD